MASVDEARAILETIGMPPAQHNEMSGLTLIALCGLTPSASWSTASRRPCTVTKGIMDYIREHYGANYAPNTRETVRRQVLHQFVHAHVAEKNPFDQNLPTNSQRAHYAVTEALLGAVRQYGTNIWDSAVASFRSGHGVLIDVYERGRKHNMVPVKLPNGKEVQLSPGKRNQVQKAVLEDFAPRFSPGATLLYMGDTAKKDLFVDQDSLTELGISINDHHKLPDVVLYDSQRNWLFLIEAVTSHGPTSPTRVFDLQALLKESSADPIYITAFPDVKEFRKQINNISWETEVWLCDAPGHMIHFNGDRFLGPQK